MRSAFGMTRGPRPVVRASLTPYTARPVAPAAVDPHVVPPPAGPAAGPPPLPRGPAAGEVPLTHPIFAELGAIDPALAKSLIDAGVAVTTTVASEAPKWAADARQQREAREQRQREARRRKRQQKEAAEASENAPAPMAAPGGIGWMHVGVGALLLLALGGAVYAFTRPRAPVRYVTQEAA